MIINPYRFTSGAPFANTKSLLFDGIDDYVSTNSKIIGSDITLSGWVNFNGGSYTSFLAQFPLSITPSNSNVTNETIGRFYKVGANMRISTQCYDQNGANFSTYTVPGLNFEGAGWQHVCWTYNVTTRHIYVYINGMAQNWLNYSGSVTTPYLTAVSGRLYESNLAIGRYNPTTSTGTFLGLVDEVSTYDRILTQAEITSISAAPSDLTSLNPVTWLRNGDNGAWKSPQWLIPNNENKDKVSNYSMYFDGLDDSINIGNISSLQSTSNFSISFWMKRDITTLSARNVMGFWVSGTNVIQFYQGTTVVRFRVDGGYVNNTTSIVQPNWNHFTLVYDGSLTGNVNRAKIYFNGVDETVNEAGTVPAVTNVGGPDFEIGTVGGIVTTHANANLDEVAFFDYSLTPTEVLSIYNGGGTATPGDLTSLSPTNYYKMGEEATFSGGVWTVPDAVGSNDGTSANMTTNDRVGDAPNSENNALSFNMDFVDVVPDTP